jgi:hypothetical protein
MKTNGIGTGTLNVLKRFLAHRYLPAILAIGAILVMLPALKTGLMGDDLVQRVVELKPGQLPARMRDTGMPPDSGSLGTVLCDLFPGFNGDPRCMALAKNYGLLPWWTPHNLRLGLWRPVTAFTHWLRFDWRTFSYQPFKIPAIGQSVTLSGPQR